MKNFILTLFILFGLANLAIAQNTVSLNIHHKLGTAPFAMNSSAQNNLGHDFEVTRLEYYLAEITVTHDGGTETPIPNVYALVNASGPTTVDLGSHNITQVEKISVHVGVDQANNHADPAQWPMSHPLAPKFPSMHWGWASGYRFVAIEGKSGSNMSQDFQLHGLGDQNYFKSEVTVSATADNGQVVIDVDADYTRVLENISLSSGVIEHGEGGPARTALQNFQRYVFSASAQTTSITDLQRVESLKVFPNPASPGQAQVTLQLAQAGQASLIVFDALGREVYRQDLRGTDLKTRLKLEVAGTYLVSVMQDGMRLATHKLMVQ